MDTFVPVVLRSFCFTLYKTDASLKFTPLLLQSFSLTLLKGGLKVPVPRVFMSKRVHCNVFVIFAVGLSQCYSCRSFQTVRWTSSTQSSAEFPHFEERLSSGAGTCWDQVTVQPRKTRRGTGRKLFHLQTPLASVAFVARSFPPPTPEGEGRNREETRDKALRTSAWEAKTPQVLVRLAIF